MSEKKHIEDFGINEDLVGPAVDDPQGIIPLLRGDRKEKENKKSHSEEVLKKRVKCSDEMEECLKEEKELSDALWKCRLSLRSVILSRFKPEKKGGLSNHCVNITRAELEGDYLLLKEMYEDVVARKERLIALSKTLSEDFKKACRIDEWLDDKK